MTTENAKILVIGAGVNGSICAVALFNAGINVTVLARGKRYEELQREGIVIEDVFKHTQTITRIPIINTLDPTDNYDYILIVVRKNQVYDLLPVLQRNISSNIVFMVNNPSGPNEYTKILGKDRVMLGFVFGGGRKEDNVIRALIPKGRWTVTPFGEIDGKITPRLIRLVDIFNQAGLHSEKSNRITDWLATHAALIPCFAKPIMKYNLDAKALAKSEADLCLIVDAMRETLDVLEAVGYRITPWTQSLVRFIPRFLLVAGLRMVLPTRFMEVGGVWHVSQAPDEMNQLATELEGLVVKSGLPVLALRKLLGIDIPLA